ncbi:hypothetical protein [Pseudorhodobacter sp.]|uniref:hypothetical protein n=1 Tax=Pseudorhodobacter sp. TaxID=1934400 RepID=UPI0039E66A60
MKQIFTLSRPKALAVLLVGALCLNGAAFAQSMPGNEDLRALRFYVENKEAGAIDAEVRRLQAEFPGWTPPADLTSLLITQPTKEVADIYARLARGDIEGVRRVLQTTKARFPSWQVPTDLARQIELIEAQAAFDRAVNTRNAAEAVRIGKRVPELFRCDRINNAWNLAELQTASGDPSRALAAYTQTVRTCTAIPDVVATIEKAEAVTSDAQLTALTDLAKQRFPAHATTFNGLNQRLLAGRGSGRVAPVAEVAAKSAPVAAPPKTAPKVPAENIPEQPAPQQRVASNAAPALASLPHSGDSRLGRARAAKEAGRFGDCLAVSARPGSLDLAYERAWCAYNYDRPLESIAYFSAAAQAGLGGTVTRDALFGLTLSLLKRGMTEDAAQTAARTNLTTDQRREVEIIILDQRGVASYQAKDYAASIDYFDALEQLQGTLRRDLAIMRGYAYLNLGDRARARAQFEALHSALATAETSKALSAAR